MYNQVYLNVTGMNSFSPLVPEGYGLNLHCVHLHSLIAVPMQEVKNMAAVRKPESLIDGCEISAMACHLCSAEHFQAEALDFDVNGFNGVRVRPEREREEE